MKIFRLKTIMGCDGRGDGDSPYLARLTFFECRFGGIYWHYFYRSDADEMHDHPWHFASLLLWRGYDEVTANGTRRYRPGSVLFRRATHAHRVQLIGGKPAISFVVRSAYVREWGFFTAEGWRDWRRYFAEKICR